MKLVILKEYTQRQNAELTVGLLKAHGIDAALQSDDLGGLTPSLGVVSGYQVMVREDDLAEAAEIAG